MFARLLSLLALASLLAGQFAAVPHAHDGTLAGEHTGCPTARHFHWAWLRDASHDHDRCHAHAGHGHAHDKPVGFAPCPPVQKDESDVAVVSDSLCGASAARATLRAASMERPLFECVSTTSEWIAVSRGEAEAAWHPPNDRWLVGDTYLVLRNLRI